MNKIKEKVLKEVGICRRCKKFVDQHYGEMLFCYGDSKSQGKFVSYKWKKKKLLKKIGGKE